MNLTELELLIVAWARDKDLIHHTQEAALAQHSKTEKVVSELLKAIAGYQDNIEDPAFLGHSSWVDEALNEIALKAGDVLVTLIIQCATQGTDLDTVTKWRVFSNSCDEALEWLGSAVTSPSGYQVQKSLSAMVMAIKKAIAPYNLTIEYCLEQAWDKIKESPQ